MRSELLCTALTASCALRDVDCVVEAVPEILDLKEKIFRCACLRPACAAL
jgi:3-hydroxyacyl-CoA dehydrogenase